MINSSPERLNKFPTAEEARAEGGADESWIVQLGKSQPEAISESAADAVKSLHHAITRLRSVPSSGFHGAIVNAVGALPEDEADVLQQTVDLSNSLLSDMGSIDLESLDESLMSLMTSRSRVLNQR